MIVLALFLLSAPLRAQDLSLQDVLVSADRFSPEVRAALAAEDKAKADVGVRESGLYPTLEAQGVQSYGFPGSNGALGLGGIMSSPFRKGPTGGLVSRLDVLDARSLYGISTAKRELAAAQARTKIARYRSDLSAAQAYFDAVRDRGGAILWSELAVDMEGLSREVEKLVQTGQHSPVEMLLVADQVTDARISAKSFDARYAAALRRLAFVIGRDSTTVSVPGVLGGDSEAPDLAAGESPLIEAARADLDSARAAVKERRAQNYPRVAALASVAGMDQSRLVNVQDYSVGLGIALPLFEGFKFSRETEGARAVADQRQYGVEAAQLRLIEESARLDEVVDASRAKLDGYRGELADARKAFALAKKRYISFEGPLVDVREALRNLARIRSAQNDAAADLGLAAAAKALINGGTASR